MVGHQAVGIYPAAKLAFKRDEIFAVIAVVVIGDKHRLTVMTALEDVMRSMGEDDSV